METIEYFKDIPNYEGLYKISNFGNVKSLSRKINQRGGYRILKERILKPTNNRGYLIIGLNKDSIKYKYLIHQLVAITFLGHKPNGHKLVINHINFNKADNRIKNLEIVTQRENANKKHLKSSSKYTGVIWDKSRMKWQSKIVINKKTVHLGRFKNEYDAGQAYVNALNLIQ